MFWGLNWVIRIRFGYFKNFISNVVKYSSDTDMDLNLWPPRCRCLRDGELFEIIIQKMVDRWSGSIEAGEAFLLCPLGIKTLSKWWVFVSMLCYQTFISASLFSSLHVFVFYVLSLLMYSFPLCVQEWRPSGQRSSSFPTLWLILIMTLGCSGSELC